MLSIYQAAAVFGDKQANLERLRRVCASAALAGSRLIVCPELFLTGYNLKDRAGELAEPVDGPLVLGVREIARDAGIAIVVGFPERDGGEVYNSAMIVGEDGEIAALYRKIHLFGDEEARQFRPGAGLQVAHLPIGRVGLAICYDIEFPEVARTLARAGAELIVVPTANMMPFVEVPTTLVRARALENGVAVAYANHCGREGELVYAGLSAIVGADGRDLARAGTDNEALMTVSLDALKGGAIPLSTQAADLREDLL